VKKYIAAAYQQTVEGGYNKVLRKTTYQEFTL